ncbi:MAG: hypothetical protein WC767_03625 [Candidatus Paceibacterota bacterium]|jgi:hypothetical protein
MTSKKKQIEGHIVVDKKGVVYGIVKKTAFSWYELLGYAAKYKTPLYHYPCTISYTIPKKKKK